MSAEKGISRREFVKGLIAGGLVAGGMLDAYNTVNKRNQAFDEARSQVQAGGITPPSEEALFNATRVRRERGTNLTPEQLQQAKETEDKQERFMRPVNKIIDGKVNRGEVPSETRVFVDFGLQIPASKMIVTRMISTPDSSLGDALPPRTPETGGAPAQNGVTHEEKS